MIKFLNFILLIIIIAASGAQAEDIEVFECTSTVKPNVLFLFDTSASMRKHGVYPALIPEYSHKRTTWGNHSSSEPYKLKYKYHETNIIWKTFGKWSIAYDNITPGDQKRIVYWEDLKPSGCTPENEVEGLSEEFCSLCNNPDTCSSCNAKEQLWEKGYFEGYLNPYYGDCSDNCPISPAYLYLYDRLIVTNNYIEYMKYVEDEIETIKWAIPADGDIPIGLSESDLDRYNPDRDYYNYYGDALGYGDYKVEYDPDINGCLKDENDIVYLNLLQVDENKKLLINKFQGGIGINTILCDEAKTNLQKYGWTRSKIPLAFTTECRWYTRKHLLMSANFLNYIDMKESRRYNGIDAVWNVLKSKYHETSTKTEFEARFGLMQFDLDYNGDWSCQGGDLSIPCGASSSQMTKFKNTLFGRFNPKQSSEELGKSLSFGDYGFELKGTPMAETLIEAGIYFAGQVSWFNSYLIPDNFFNNEVDYTTTDSELNLDSHQAATTSGDCKYRSPIQCQSQKNHIIIITDGAPTRDKSPKIRTEAFYHYLASNERSSSTIGDYHMDGAVEEPYLSIYQYWADDVAKFLHTKDLSPLSEPQIIKTHVISFVMDADEKAFDETQMTNIAANGGTTNWRKARNKKELETQINEILKGILMTGTFSSAITPVKQDDLIYSGDKTFLTSFKIGDGTRGTGNIKRYKREGEKIMGKRASNPDAFGELITNNGINENIRDIWWENDNSSETAKIPTEGVAYILWKQLNDLNPSSLTLEAKLDAISGINGRKIYSNTDLSKNQNINSIKELALADSGNILIKDTSVNNMTEDTLKNFLINGIYGLGLDWPLGDITHSDIVVAEFPDSSEPKTISASLIFAGANDGMLHCFNAESGKEEWAFIPPDFLGNKKLAPLESNYHNWYVDGGITIFSEIINYGENVTETTDPDSMQLKAKSPEYLIFGERRGGNYYHILRIKDILISKKPEYIRGITETDSGQSWSKPRLCRVKSGSIIKTGFLVGGGYDEKYDDRAYDRSNPKGKFIAIYNIENGDMIGEKIGTDTITDSVVAARINDIDHDENRIFSTILAGDLGGNVYRYNADNNGAWSGYKLFTCPSAINTNVNVPQKIFYAPVLSNNPEIGIDMIYFGTGDRENPKESETNGIYGVQDSPEGGLTSATLYKFNLIVDGPDTDIDGKIYRNYKVNCEKPDTDNPKGWYFDLTNGEKVIAEPIVLGNILIMATNIPADETSNEESGPCQTKGCDSGTGRVYIINASVSSFGVKSFNTGSTDPMPQPKIVFDKDSGKVMISTGDGGLYDPQVSVLNGQYWRHNTND